MKLRTLLFYILLAISIPMGYAYSIMSYPATELQVIQTKAVIQSGTPFVGTLTSYYVYLPALKRYTTIVSSGTYRNGKTIIVQLTDIGDWVDILG